MANVVVDANVLIAARFSRDQNHERGEAIAHATDTALMTTAHCVSRVS